MSLHFHILYNLYVHALMHSLVHCCITSYMSPCLVSHCTHFSCNPRITFSYHKHVTFWVIKFPCTNKIDFQSRGQERCILLKCEAFSLILFVLCRCYCARGITFKVPNANKIWQCVYLLSNRIKSVIKSYSDSIKWKKENDTLVY